jgi:two-component system invasion response regulator UvrY
MAKKILIVDERAVARQAIRRAAATPHDTVLECGSADEAHHAVGVFKPDCVLMGVTLPAPNTLKVIKSIRKTHPEVRVVAVSAFDETESRRASAEAGASAYVTSENLSELFLLAAPERLSASTVRRKKIRRAGN